ncbi:MAG: ribonuclease P protein component [Lactobacillales bacterium]|nr:ribonuclease P protein component [Lactobacillales bacterium]
MRKSYRVKKEKEFQAVFHTGKSYANKRFIIYQLSPRKQPHFRVGISVSKKLGNAVTRNKIKRKIRQAILELSAEIRPDVDFIVIARYDAKNLTVAETVKNLQHILMIAKVIPKN